MFDRLFTGIRLPRLS